MPQYTLTATATIEVTAPSLSEAKRLSFSMLAATQLKLPRKRRAKGQSVSEDAPISASVVEVTLRDSSEATVITTPAFDYAAYNGGVLHPMVPTPPMSALDPVDIVEE